MNKCRFLTPCGICEIKSMSGIPYDCDLMRKGKLEEENRNEDIKPDCLDQDAKEASIPYSYNAPEHDWKCGYPTDMRGKEE